MFWSANLDSLLRRSKLWGPDSKPFATRAELEFVILMVS